MSQEPSPWEFLPDDDSLPREGDQSDRAPAEEAAMHEEGIEALRRARDPGKTDVMFRQQADDFIGGDSHLDDEEPEVPATTLESDDELELQELLERQHYLGD